jgi:predicted MFS family arabinose efflux permease
LQGEDRTGVLATIALGWFLSLGVRYLLPAVLPQIKAAFDIGDATAGLAITLVWVGYGAMQFPAGALADGFDERALLAASLALAGGGLALIGAAPVFSVFLVACGLLGLATGLFGPARGIALSRFFPSNPGRAFGVTLAAGSIGSATLPFLAAAVVERLGWRLAVGLPVPLFVATAASTWVVVPTGRGGDDEDAGLSLGGVRRTVRRALADRAIVVGVLGTTFMLFTYQALTAFLPTYLIQEKGISQPTASGLFALLFVAGAGSHLMAGAAADRVGSRPVALAIATVGVIALAALPFVDGLLPLAALVVVLSTRVGFPSVLNPYIIRTLPEEATGTAWGLFRTGFFLVGATGSTVVGVLSDAGLFDEAFYLLAGLTGVAAVLFVFLPVERAVRGE